MSRERVALAGALAGVILLFAGGARGGTLTAATIPASPASPQPGAAFLQDKGTFRILVNGQQVGKEEFEIASRGGDWVAHDTSEIQGAGGTSRVTGTLELHADGTPAHYEWSTQGEKKATATIGFEGSTATIDLHIEGVKPYTQQFTFNSPQVVILDNNLYYQYAVLASLYDWNRKGTQTFAVLVPQELTPGTVTVESAGTHDAGGKKLEELAVKSPDLEVDLFLDGQRLVRIVSPSANAEILRDK
ncbi:MAG TPA: hypothetical protein VN788_13990, partial [Verrucomicrobiae bacterium]|nr:hypothetical protein [Verrucomicrobiae bacterium]